VLALRRQDVPDATRDEAAQADKNRKGKASNRDWESTTDPESRIMQHSDGHTHLSYKVDATVDLESGVIVAAGANFGDASDQSDCLERVDEAKASLEERGLKPIAVVGDKGHHSGENLVGIEDRGLIPLISSPNHNRGKPGFRREDFIYDQTSDTLICPCGQMMTRLSKGDGSARHYKAKGSVCRSCPNFGVCTTDRRGRAVMVSVYEEQMRANRDRVHSEEARPLMQIRRQRGEAPFGYFKQFGGLRRFAGRGLVYATKKVLIAALGWNLLVLVKALIRHTPSTDTIVGLIQLILALMKGMMRPWTRFHAPKPRKTRDQRQCGYHSPFISVTAQKATLSGGC